MVFLRMNGIGAKVVSALACLMLAGCLGSSGGDQTQTTNDIVDSIPNEIIPIIIENEEDIREIIDTELDEELREQADDILDLIVTVATTTVSATVTVAAATTQ